MPAAKVTLLSGRKIRPESHHTVKFVLPFVAVSGWSSGDINERGSIARRFADICAWQNQPLSPAFGSLAKVSFQKKTPADPLGKASCS